MIEEVLAAWREAERILEQHRERPERDREAEAPLVEQIETLRALQGSLTSGSMATTTALAQSRERIAETWELLGTMRR